MLTINVPPGLKKMAKNFSAYDEALSVLAEPRTGLVLAGPPGSGKTTLAYKLVRGLPIWKGSLGLLASPFAPWGQTEPRALLVDDLAVTRRQWNDLQGARDLLKAAITNQTIRTHIKGQSPRWMRSPMVIVCTNDPKLWESEQGFKVVRVG